MSRTVEVPGGSAVLRDPDELSERQRRVVRKAVFAAAADALGDELPTEAGQAPTSVHLSAATPDLMFGTRDAAIVASLVSWTLPDPLPTVETVQDLPAGLYDALAEASAGLISGLTVDFAPSPDPDSPTPPPSASNGLLADGPSPSTPTPLTVGVSTPTASSTA